MTDRMNFAVIGCGFLARSKHIPNLAASKLTRLHTCCDLSDAALAECRERYGPLRTTNDFRAAINDPEVEAIVLATVENMRLPIIAAAAEARKPVYCEKPVADTIKAMYEIQKVVKQSGIPFCVGHNRRSSPAMQDAHAIFRRHMTNPKPCPWRWDREGPDRPRLEGDGVAGMSVRINDDWYSWKAWAMDKNIAPHGPLLFEMTHFTDLCNWFLAAEPREVVAIEDGLNHAVIIRYQTGEMATITMSGNGTFGYPKELYEMFGNGAAVVVDHMLEVRTAGVEGAPARKTYPMLSDRHRQVGTEGGLLGWLEKKRAACREAAEKGDPMLQFTAEPDKGHMQAIERFVAEIRGQGPVVCGIDDTILATRVSFAAIRSAAERRIVSLSEV